MATAPPVAAGREADERTALLDERTASGGTHQNLPKVQILLLCTARVVEPVAFFSIFTFVNQQIADSGDVDTKDIGFYTGMIESIFSATQLVFMIGWGRLADRIGRKPTLVGSLMGVAVAVVLFGFSKHVWQMFLCRALAGAFASSVVTIRTALAELSTEETQARAFSYMAFAVNLGIFLGPLVGGLLSRPAKQYPSVFKGLRLFEIYPYCLPGLMNGFFTSIVALLLAVYFKETLPAAAQRQQTEGVSVRSALAIPGVKHILLVTAAVVCQGFAFTTLMPLFEFTPVELGGLGFEPQQISLMTAIAGLAQSLWLLLIFPPLQRRIGTLGVLQWCCYLWPLNFLAIGPVGNAIRRTSVSPKAIWIYLPVASAVGSGVSMAFTCVQMSINHVSPSSVVLGTLNGLSTSVMSFTRIFAPSFATSLWAVGVHWGRLNGQLCWLVLVSLAILQIPLAMRMPSSADSKPSAKAL